VTASGPPLRYAAGPGSAPAEWGPAWNRPLRKVRRDPPPAATVDKSSIGAKILRDQIQGWVEWRDVLEEEQAHETPAVVDSNVDS